MGGGALEAILSAAAALPVGLMLPLYIHLGLLDGAPPLHTQIPVSLCPFPLLY